MVWWIAGGVVLASLAGLAAVVGILRRRVAELNRVAELAQEQAGQRQARLQAGAERLQATLADLQRRSVVIQRRLSQLRAGRAADR